MMFFFSVTSLKGATFTCIAIFFNEYIPSPEIRFLNIEDVF